MYKGGCMCGAVRFEIHGPIENIVYCHCSQCRKLQGSAFATNGRVDSDKFKIVSGQDQLTGYEMVPGLIKSFCKICGSPIMGQYASKPEYVRIRLGTIESEISETPSAHIFATSKAGWDRICDDLPQYEGFEPGR